MSSNEDIRIGIISPPDRELLTAEIMVGSEQWAELNQEAGQMRVEFYSRRDGRPWVLNFDTVITALTNANEKLSSGGSGLF